MHETASYHMLSSADGGGTWEYGGLQEAPSRDAALRAFFGKPQEGVQYVAVAPTGWRPVALQTRTVVRKTKTLQPVEATAEPPTLNQVTAVTQALPAVTA